MSVRMALVMIARDEARCIARCLESVRPWVDEMVVLDTGSNDATPQIAQACGAAVHHAAWADDFAAARNAALALTDADWRLVLDADEWLRDGGERVRGALTAAHPFVALLQVTSLLDGGAGEASSNWLPRLLPRGVGYAGRVHEQPQSTLPRHRLAAEIAHDGYLDAQLGAKRGRNERLLRIALEEEEADPYLHYQLAKDLELQGRYVDAAPHYAQAAAGAAPQVAWRHDLVLRRLFTLKKVGAFEAAFAIAEAEMAHWTHSPDFFFTLGDVLLDWAVAEPGRAGELMPMIESCWLQALQIGEQPALNDSVRGRGSWLAAYNLAALHGGLGDHAQAQAWRERSRLLRAAAAL